MKTEKAIANKKAYLANTPENERTYKIFDWEQARELCEGAESASAGLSGDWEYTGGTIWRNGAPCNEDYRYLISVWAIPEISVDGGPKQPCYREVPLDSAPDAPSYWPELKGRNPPKELD